MGLRVGLGLELGLSCGNGYLTSIGPNTKHSGQLKFNNPNPTRKLSDLSTLSGLALGSIQVI